jgi:hypothetical protein
VAQTLQEPDAERVTNPYLLTNTPPAGVPAVPLHMRQQLPTEVQIQRAAGTVHGYTSRVATVQEVGAVVVAFAGLASALFDKGQSQVAIGGFIWFVISAWWLGYLAQKFTEQAALIQETFDCRLFHLDWNETLAPANSVTQNQVIDLAERAEVGSKADKRITDGWYDPTDGLEYPYDVLCTQEQNLLWDLRLRRRFRHALAALGAAWTLIGFVVALSGTSMAETLLVVFVPAAAAYDLGRERWRTQRHVETERGRLAQVVGHALSTGTPGPLAEAKRAELRLLARRVQDGIFRTRSEFGRVPNTVYLRNREKDEKQLAEIVECHRSRLT